VFTDASREALTELKHACGRSAYRVKLEEIVLSSLTTRPTR